MNASNYLITKVLNHLTGNATWTAPSGLWVALLQTAPAAGDLTTTNAAKEVEESATNGYARQALTMGAESSQISISSGVLTFGPSTTGWDQVVGAWVVDSATIGAGNIWYQGLLATAKTAGANDSILFATGEIILALA